MNKNDQDLVSFTFSNRFFIHPIFIELNLWMKWVVQSNSGFEKIFKEIDSKIVMTIFLRYLFSGID